MSLRAAGISTEDENRVPVNFRCPPELKKYIDDASDAPGRSKTEVITSALELDRGLETELRADEERIAAFAGASDLRTNKDLPVILARLVRRGLESWEREHRNGKKARTR